MSAIPFIALPALALMVGCSAAPDPEVGRSPGQVERDPAQVEQAAEVESAPPDEPAGRLSPAARAMARREALAVERGEPVVEDWRCFSVINMFGPCCSKHGEQDPDFELVE